MTTNSALEIVRQQFDNWRSDPQRVKKIPERLWKLIPPLLDQYKVSLILRTLRLNHAQLKRHLAEPRPRQAIATAPPQKANNSDSLFVSCDIPFKKETSDFQLELQRVDGSVLRVKELNPHSLDAILHVFLR